MLNQQRWKLAELAELKSIVEPEEICPVSMTLDLTHNCNYKCSGCIEKEARVFSKHTSLMLETVKELIKKFKSVYNGQELLLYGGEPLIYPYFPEVIRYASSYFPTVRVVTNGSILDEERIAEAICEVAEKTNLSVRVSLNSGTPETHEKLHGVTGYFHRIVKGMKELKGKSKSLKLGVSFLLEDKNAMELVEAYNIANDVGAELFWLRAKTGLHGIKLLPLTVKTRRAVLEALEEIEREYPAGPSLWVEDWFLEYLRSGVEPDTEKPYPVCYYNGAARIVVTPPDPGQVWSCTYWRADQRFLIADLKDVPFGSEEFETKRKATIRRIIPFVDCEEVICNRNEGNKILCERAGLTKVAVTK